jgi:hypothetical protein
VPFLQPQFAGIVVGAESQISAPNTIWQLAGLGGTGQR